MADVLAEVLDVNDRYAAAFGEKGSAAAGAALCHPDMHGRTT